MNITNRRHTPVTRGKDGLEATVASDPGADSGPVDVSIVTFNSVQWLPALISSLAQGCWPAGRIRILIHDCGSHDASVAMANELSDRWGELFAGFEISASDNIGFGAGQNRNLKRAKSRFFLVLNPDTELEVDALDAVMHFAARDAAETAAWEFRQAPCEHPKLYDPVTLETDWVSGACVLLRTECLRSAGGFDERIFLYGEDVDLSWRLRAGGLRLRYLPWAVCRHYSDCQPGRVKAAQYAGGLRANLLLRLRFGTVAEIFWAPMLLGAGVIRGTPDCSRVSLAAGLIGLLRQVPHFLATRQAWRGRFDWFGLGYGPVRPGAFHPLDRSDHEAPLVSIVVRTTANGVAGLAEALQSILNQTWPAIEIVVVEDGSRAAQALCDQLDGSAGRSIRYRSLPRSGRARAGNTGLAMCRGEYIGFLDDDDCIYADHIEALITALERQPRAVAAYAPAFEALIDDVGLPLWRIGPRNLQVPWRVPFSRVLLQYVNYLPIQSVLLRRSLYAAEGGFDEQLEMLEDWDLWARYALAGDFVYVDKTTSVFRTPSGWRPRRRRERALRSAQHSIRARNRNRCRGSRYAGLAPALEALADGERGMIRLRSLISGVCGCLPGGFRLYEWLVGRRRRHLAARARELESELSSVPLPPADQE